MTSFFCLLTVIFVVSSIDYVRGDAAGHKCASTHECVSTYKTFPLSGAEPHKRNVFRKFITLGGRSPAVVEKADHKSGPNRPNNASVHANTVICHNCNDGSQRRTSSSESDSDQELLSGTSDEDCNYRLSSETTDSDVSPSTPQKTTHRDVVKKTPGVIKRIKSVVPVSVRSSSSSESDSDQELLSGTSDEDCNYRLSSETTDSDVSPNIPHKTTHRDVVKKKYTKRRRGARRSSARKHLLSSATTASDAGSNLSDTGYMSDDEDADDDSLPDRWRNFAPHHRLESYCAPSDFCLRRFDMTNTIYTKLSLWMKVWLLQHAKVKKGLSTELVKSKTLPTDIYWKALSSLSSHLQLHHRQMKTEAGIMIYFTVPAEGQVRLAPTARVTTQNLNIDFKKWSTNPVVSSTENGQIVITFGPRERRYAVTVSPLFDIIHEVEFGTEQMKKLELATGPHKYDKSGELCYSNYIVSPTGCWEVHCATKVELPPGSDISQAYVMVPTEVFKPAIKNKLQGLLKKTKQNTFGDFQNVFLENPSCGRATIFPVFKHST